MPHAPEPCPPQCRSCAYEKRSYRCAADALFRSAGKALQEMGPIKAKVDYDTLSMKAVFRVFFFKDDLYLAVRSKGDHSILRVRSESRKGNGDLGVNQRRVNNLLRHIAHFYNAS